MYVYLTMHLVALYKGFIILQVCARVPDVGPDVFIQIPGLITGQILPEISVQQFFSVCLFFLTVNIFHFALFFFKHSH